MLMSMMSAPAASAIRAPSAIQRASQPASCTTCGPTPVASQRNRDIGLPAHEIVARDHFGNDQPRAQVLRQAAGTAHR